ncbi:hypothetical protein C7974DRAFT_457846 [Boeremia exigua]|uniref:uncharacterized protein n=1 Tax=Boeremia exigua TaxID=749465 RepID=UPI001E8EE699|nr:uncharacterized protein C7974DRAFT_457846 [Boeremia exigua]KAH6620026.1 hypothetical protein C7974DRAFT_457846 [Boeremia exigua]
MTTHRLNAHALMLLFHAISVLSTFTNLPAVPQGIFNVSTRIEIHSNKIAAWEALTDFPRYPEWNPFVRASVMVSPGNATLHDQRPKEGLRLFLRTQIPALPSPVNNTPQTLRPTPIAWEAVTDLDLQAERWSAISDIGRGKVLYESREVFHGDMAESLKSLIGETLQACFDAQAQAFKVLLEDCNEHWV